METNINIDLVIASAAKHRRRHRKMASRRSSSGHGTNCLPPQPNLNPSARSFTPVAVTPSAYSPPVQHHVELAYHQIKAAEAARMIAQARLPPAGGPDQIHVRKRRVSVAFSVPSETAPSRSASAPSSAVVADRDPPRTPPNQYIKPKNVAPTPPAHTFNDDDEFYPGADPQLIDPRLKKPSRGDRPRESKN